MKIALIGCGYVGRAVAIKLRQSGFHILATTRSHHKASTLKTIADAVHVMQGSDADSLSQVLMDRDAVILTLAADSPEDYQSTYLDTAKALKKAIAHAPNLKQIIYTGSTSVYGDHAGAVVDETTLPFPQNLSSQVLLKTEEALCALDGHERAVCIFRLGEIYGPGRELSGRLRLLNGRPLPGSGDSITNLIHLNEIVGAIEFCLDKHLRGIYNLCNDIHIPRKQLYEKLCVQEGLPPVVWDSFIPSRHAGNKTVSNNRIKAAGYIPIENELLH